VKDLGSRWTVLAIILALGTLAVSTDVEGQTRVGRGNASLLASEPSINFGTVAIGSSATQSNYISNSSDTSITIGKAITSGSYFEVLTPLPVTIPPGQGAQFVFRFAPNRQGALPGSITIWSGDSAAGSEERASLRIPVWGLGAQGNSNQGGSLTASDSLMDFGAVAVGSSTTLENYISNSSDNYVTIGKAITSGSYFQVMTPLPVTIAPGERARFVFKFTPNRSGQLQGTITIWSANSRSGNETPTLVIPLAGVGGKAPTTGGGSTPGSLAVSSRTLTFGKVQVGSTEKQSATVTNNGGSTVTLKQASVTGTGFSMSPMGMPMTLAPKQSATLSVSCAPKTSGTLVGSLTIATDASTGNVAVPLSATAVANGSLSASAASLSFGSIAVDTTKSLPETITNNGGASVTLSQAVAGAGFSVSGLSLPLTLSAGQSASFTVVFAPQATGNSNLNLSIVNSSDTPMFTIPLSGSALGGGSLSVSSVSFGSVQVGGSSTKSAIITNSGSSAVTISQATVTGGTAFKISGLTTPLTLNAGQNLTYNVTFTPQASGSASASIALVSTAATPAPAISLSGSGTATGALSISPTTFAFGSVNVGSSKSMPVTLSASGSNVTVNSATVSSSEFAITGPSLPLTIQAGSTASFTLAFNPQSGGSAAASLSFDTSASASPMSESLSGTGAATAQHSVDLAWNASKSSVAGYNVYRGSKTGGPYAKLNASTNDGMTYTDSSVQAGQTYFYTTTAVADDGTESTFSNEVKALIPTP
jgi:hypothetical protein